MKKITVILAFIAFSYLAYGQKEQSIVFKYKIQAEWMQKRFLKVGLYRPYKKTCMVLKCEYNIAICEGDEFLYMPNRKKLIIPRNIQMKLK